MLACLMTALCQCALPSGLIEDAFGRREDAALLLSDSALPSPHALKPPRRLKCTEYRTKQECFADWGYAGDDDAMDRPAFLWKMLHPIYGFASHTQNIRIVE